MHQEVRNFTRDYLSMQICAPKIRNDLTGTRASGCEPIAAINSLFRAGI